MPATPAAAASVLALALVLAPAGAPAQEPRTSVADAASKAAAPAEPGPWTPPAALAARVGRDVAARWSLESARVALDWGRIAPPAGSRLDEARVASVSPDGMVLLDVPGANPGTNARLALRAGVRTPRVVAARALARGDLLRAGDLALDSVTTWGMPARAAAGRDPAPATGWRVNRYVAAGEPLAPPTVTPPAAVRAGSRVRAIYSAGALQLTVAATAAADAAPGQPVSLRTDDGRRLVGVAEADGTVRLGEPAANAANQRQP